MLSTSCLKERSAPSILCSVKNFWKSSRRLTSQTSSQLANYMPKWLRLRSPNEQREAVWPFTKP